MSSELNEVKVGAIWTTRKLYPSVHDLYYIRSINESSKHARISGSREMVEPLSLRGSGFSHGLCFFGENKELELYRPSTYPAKAQFYARVSIVKHRDLVNEFKELLVELEI